MNNKKPFSKRDFLLRTCNFDDLFKEEEYPIEVYKLQGDRKSIKQIKIDYLHKIINKSSVKNLKYQDNCCRTSPSTDKFDYQEPPKSARIWNNRKNINTIKEKENSEYFDDDLDSESVKVQKQKSGKGQMMSRQESEEFLLDLYVQGITQRNPFSAYEPDEVLLANNQKEEIKIEENNPYLYSFTELHPFSMFYQTKYKELISTKKNIKCLKLPAPKFISNDEWRTPMDYSYESLFKELYVNNKLGLEISDPIVRNKFSGLVKDIIIQILKVPFGHHISLNVKIFEPKTVLGRYTVIFSNANRFLIPAAEPNLSPYERFKAVVTFLVSGMYIGSEQLKPFNPFLGETYQAEFPNGAKLYVENVTHTPLVARFLLTYQKIYEVSGYWALSVKSSGFGNEMAICSKGPVYVRFPLLNECVCGHIPEVKVVNATSEKNRALKYTGNQVFVDPKNNYKAVVVYDFNKENVFELKGNTMKFNFPKDYTYNYENEWEYGKNYKVDNKKEHPDYEIIDSIKGSWIANLIIGNDNTWDAHKHVPEYLKPVKNCIPSDGKFREDLIWLYRSFYCAKNTEEENRYRQISMEWKVMMEEFNRWERKKRKDGQKLLKKKSYK